MGEIPVAPNDARVEKNVETEKYEYVSNDNVRYEWSEGEKAWFPMYDEELVKLQQSVYGTAQPFDDPKVLQRRKKEELKEKQRQEREAQRAIRKNTAIYVSGLPSSATFEDIEEYFKKCGIIMVDFETGKAKIKMYKDEQGQFKGDCTVFYFQDASVNIACDIYDESEFTPGCKIKVQPAKFEEKRAEEGKKRKVDKVLMKKRLEQLQKKLNWDESQDLLNTEKFKRIVVLKHMFSKQELDDHPEVILEIKEDIRNECSKFGEVSSVKLFEESEEGLATVKFKNEISAQLCVQKTNGRCFGGQQIQASIYDGSFKLKKTKSREAAEEEQERLEKFAEWLESNKQEN